MPKGYVIARITVSNMEAYKAYVADTADAIRLYEGTFLARGGAFEKLEGEARERNVIIEFASFERAKAFYHSREYQRAKGHRAGAAIADIVAVEGVE
jgi:uncharacterized protein (DUF1330 family)